MADLGGPLQTLNQFPIDVDREVPFVIQMQFEVRVDLSFCKTEIRYTTDEKEAVKEPVGFTYLRLLVSLSFLYVCFVDT